MKWKQLWLLTTGRQLVPLVFAVILFYALFAALVSGQDRIPTYSKFAWDFAAGERKGTLLRYGNWFGPGWWGASEDPKRVGMLPPIDALDKIAQKHDFGYQVAEELGKHRPEIVAYYKAMADGIAVRDAMALPKDPARWVPPPKNIELARRYRDRIAVGFRDLWQNWNELLASNPMKQLDPADPDDLELILAGRISDKEFEARALALVRDWEKKYKQWQIVKSAKIARLEDVPDEIPLGSKRSITVNIEGLGLSKSAPICPEPKPGAICIPDPTSEGEYPQWKVTWHADRFVTFLPPTTTSNTTVAQFDRPGRVRIWAEVLVLKDGVYKSVAKTEPTAVLVTDSMPSTSGAVSLRALDAKVVTRPEPVYPAAARTVGASGPVEVEILVDSSGNVESAEAVSGHPLLRASAEKAAREATFRPHMQNGRAVKVKGTLTYEFKVRTALADTTSGRPPAAQRKSPSTISKPRTIIGEWVMVLEGGGKPAILTIWNAGADLKATITYPFTPRGEPVPEACTSFTYQGNTLRCAIESDTGGDTFTAVFKDDQLEGTYERIMDGEQKFKVRWVATRKSP